MKVLVTINSFQNHEDVFKNYDCDFVYRYQNSATLDDIKDADILLGCVDLNYLDNANNLKYIHWGMAGSDTIANKIKDKNIILTNSTGCFSLSIAENVLGMIMYFNKKFYKYVRNQDQHLYKKEGATTSIYESKVLILGCGSIGMTCAKMLNDLGAEVTGIKRTVSQKPDFLKALYTDEKLDECLKDADIVIMSMPQNKQTIHMMNADKLSKLKDGAILINVGRGTAIDTDALINELSKGRIFAGLDVYEKEPLDENSKLWDLKNCLVLPHVTGFDNMAYTRKLLRQLAVENLDAYLNHKQLKNIVDFNTGYKVSNT